MTFDQEQKMRERSKDGGWLQSPAWAAFQQAVGREYRHLSDENGYGNWFVQTLSGVGRYGYMPRGPVFFTDRKTEFLQFLVSKAREENLAWLRLEPETAAFLSDSQKKGFNLVKAPHNTQPKEVLVLDITPSEEELLARMKPKTRYNIRLATKRGVQVSTTRTPEAISRFLDLVAITAKRDRIITHPRAYYEKMLASIPESQLKLYVAEYANVIIAGALIVEYGEGAIYLHGASANEQRELMAPYLIQWEALKAAKAHGRKYYDLGGVALTEKKSHWTGITRFKTGFAPTTPPQVFLGDFDLIIKPGRYWLYRALRLLSHLKRFL